MTPLKRPVSLFLLLLMVPFVIYPQENKTKDKDKGNTTQPPPQAATTPRAQ